MVDKTWLNRAAGLKLCYGVFISLEGKNSKNKVPGLVLVNRDKGDWSADLMVFEQGLRPIANWGRATLTY